MTIFFGENSEMAQLMDLFLSHPWSKYTKEDLIECCELKEDKVTELVKRLLDLKMINTAHISINKYEKGYILNKDSTLVIALNSFDNQLADINMEKEMKKAGVKPIKPFETCIKLNPHITLDLPVKIEKDHELNCYVATTVNHIASQGWTPKEAFDHVKEAAELYFEGD